MSFRRIILCGLLAFIAVAIGSPFVAPSNTTPPRDAPLRVVASFTIPADWVREIGGAHVVVESIVPPDGDPHAYHPTLADMRRLRKADLIVALDPVLEHWFAPLVADSRFSTKTVWLATAKPEKTEPPELHTEPHLWMDPLRVIPLVQLLAKRMADADPANAKAYAAAAAAYTAALRQLDAQARKQLAAVPAERRVLFSHHDNLRRLAHRYDMRIGGTLMATVSTEGADPAAGELAALIRNARAAGVPIFHDNTASPALVLTVTRDADLPPPVRLYTDALSTPQSPASTYLALCRENIRRIAEALAAPTAK